MSFRAATRKNACNKVYVRPVKVDVRFKCNAFQGPHALLLIGLEGPWQSCCGPSPCGLIPRNPYDLR